VAEASRLVHRLARLRARLAEALARRRVPLGFVSSVLVLWLATPSGASLLAGTPIAVLGEALRFWAAGHLNKSNEVTASGPYRWFAHPLYVGSSLMGLGLAVASASLGVAALIAVYMGVTIAAAIKSEEAFLRARFGDGYDRYRTAGVVDRGRRFSPAQAIRNHEHRAIIGLLLVLLLLVLKATYNGTFWRTAETAAGRLAQW
jgi:protein-S-isoprenylcysteine O-methyltransferase Ste14